MNLSQSILVSLIICFVFWGGAFFQSEVAQAFSFDSTSNKNAVIERKNELEKVKSTVESLQKTEKIEEKSPINEVNNSKRIFNISGLTQHQSLNQINHLWQEFNDSNYLHKRLIKQPKVVYVLYRGFSENYQEATITIGYDLSTIDKSTNKIEINLNNYNTILPRKNYPNEQIIQGWEKINYSQGVEAVLEIHHMARANQPESAQLLVVYK